MMALRKRYIFIASSFLLSLIAISDHLRLSNYRQLLSSATDRIQLPKISPSSYPKYKPEPQIQSPPIVENFPFAAAAHSASELPTIPSWSLPPAKHVEEKTPLFIGFTRNWRLLQQVVVSYITAGWPPADIYVVENTGVMDSNAKGKLSLQNPFFLNHTRLEMFGVNILRTPTLLTFAQLQNFYLHTSIEKEWPAYFWSHMDVVVLSFEAEYAKTHPDALTPLSGHENFETLYNNCVKVLQQLNTLKQPKNHWALRFFNYDRLTLVNVAAYVDVGGYDTMIPYYATDCDMHSRISMAEWGIEDVAAGTIIDVASSLDDLVVLYRKANTGVRASFQEPNEVGKELQAAIEKEEREKKAERKDRRSLDFNSRNKNESTDSWTRRGQNVANSLIESMKGAKLQWEEDSIYSEEFKQLEAVLNSMAISKEHLKAGRNSWQTRQRGGEGEPFYRDANGFNDAVLMTIEHGRRVYAEKWGHRDCDIIAKGLKPMDAWRVEHDW